MERKITISWSAKPEDTRDEESFSNFEEAGQFFVNKTYELDEAGVLGWVKFEDAGES